MSVLLPAPFSPINACTSPGTTSNVTLRSACVPPKLFLTCSTRSLGVIQFAFELRCDPTSHSSNTYRTADKSAHSSPADSYFPALPPAPPYQSAAPLSFC